MDPDFRRATRPLKSVTVDPTPSPTETPATQTFQPSETVAPAVASENVPQPKTFEPPTALRTKPSWRSRLTDNFHTHKREWLASTLIVLFCGGLVGLVLIMTDKKPEVAAVKPVKKVEKKVEAPKVVPSTLSGLPVDPTVNQRTVTGVMVENSLAARPQSGLSQAGVVFEAIAEGGITRFLALYQDTEPENVGPVRSARPYYAQWALGFDAGYAHVGGSPAALRNIKEWGVRDLDQFHNAGAYRRIASRQAPHNVYTSLSQLNQLETSKGFTTSTFKGFERKKEAASKQPNAKSINMAISGPVYNSHYDYDAASNAYKRSMAGAAHIDANTNAQISPKVVIALVMSYGFEADGYHSTYGTIGSGVALIFQDGVLTKGTWNKTDNKAQFTFTDATGKAIGLNPGQTWITAVKAEANVTFQP
jgi:hypothetical protein